MWIDGGEVGEDASTPSGDFEKEVFLVGVEGLLPVPECE